MTLWVAVTPTISTPPTTFGMSDARGPSAASVGIGGVVSTFRFEIDGEAFRTFQRELRKTEPALAKSLNKELRNVVKDKVVPAAKANASWSTRIPGAIKPQVTTKQIGVRVAGSGSGRKGAIRQAAHGYAFENTSNTGWFRHPVFGNRNVWVNQNARPFLRPAVESNQEAVVTAAMDAVDAAGRAAGFR